MKNLIIVEGCDNSGKTALARKLAADLRLLLMNNRKLPTSIEDMVVYRMMVSQVCQHFPTILDRFSLISEPIYGPICRQVDILPSADAIVQLHKLDTPRLIIIYCRPRDECILRFGEIEQMDSVVDHAPELIAAYDRVMKTLSQAGFMVLHYDWEQDSYDSLMSYLNNRL